MRKFKVTPKLSVTASKRAVNCASSTFTVEEIADSLYHFAPMLADDLLYDDYSDSSQLLSEQEFIDYLERKAYRTSELEFESESALNEWIQDVINASCFR